MLPVLLAIASLLAIISVDGKLIFSEIHFAGSRIEETEFVEIFNSGNQSVPLAGVTIESGVDFAFPINETRAIAPQTYIVVVQNVRCQGMALFLFFFFFFFFFFTFLL
jgi:hypothetical protein